MTHRPIGMWSVVLLVAACEGGGGNATGAESTSGASSAETSGDASAEAPMDTSESDPMPSTTSDDVCHAGYEKCPCMDGLCLDGLVCLSDLCVQPAIEGSSEDGESSTSTVGDSSSDGAGSSSDESSTTAVFDDCLDHDNYCDGNVLQVCDDGYWEYTTCDDVCAEDGYLSPGCATPDACLCEGYADATCDVGAWNLCVCAELDYDIPCTAAQQQEFYDECWTGAQAYVECFAAGGMIDEYADCAPLEDACL